VSDQKPAFTCDNCGRLVEPDAQKYIIKIEMYASADPIVITDEMLKEDPVEKLEELVEEMERVDPQELEDQIFEAYEFELCPACREGFHRDLIRMPGKKKNF
jgi:hypothetical protein